MAHYRRAERAAKKAWEAALRDETPVRGEHGKVLPVEGPTRGAAGDVPPLAGRVSLEVRPVFDKVAREQGVTVYQLTSSILQRWAIRQQRG